MPGRSPFPSLRVLAGLFLALGSIASAVAQQTDAPPKASTSGAPEVHAPTLPSAPVKNVDIPRIAAAPTINDFEGMQPRGAATQMAVVKDFTQTSPSDGSKPSQRTEVYLGYNASNLYVVWLCFDTEVDKVRAH